MDLRRTLTRGGRRGTIALVLAVVLLLGGGTALAWAATHQQSAPQPTASASGTAARSSTPAPPSAPASSPANTAPPLPPENPHLPAATPVAITIPAIHVHSALQKLGLNPDGTVQTPQPGPHYDEAGWFTGSATPGQLGVSVILGHIDSAANGPSVFFRLGAVKPGEQVVVDRADGSRATFTVDAVKEFPKSDFPTVQVYKGNPDTAGLRLLTCGGPFDRRTRNYLDNIVVFAHLDGTPT